jgi:hypothetical protein
MKTEYLLWDERIRGYGNKDVVHVIELSLHAATRAAKKTFLSRNSQLVKRHVVQIKGVHTYSKEVELLRDCWKDLLTSTPVEVDSLNGSVLISSSWGLVIFILIKLDISNKTGVRILNGN